MTQHCLKKSKHCKPSICFITSKKNYICSGVSSRGTKFNEDKIWLCIHGKLSKTAMEMTTNEALGIASVLMGSIFTFDKLKQEVGDKNEKSKG